jgi:hypothetical protein
MSEAKKTTDGMIKTFTTNGVVDEETQKNDLDIVREVLNVTSEVPIERACDFSFAKKADGEAGNLRNFTRGTLRASTRRGIS